MKQFWARHLAPLRPRRPQWNLALRVTLAATSALAAGLALHLRLPLWAVLTAIIVTQMSVGGSLKVAADYLIGTVGGALYGGAISIFVPHHGELALLGVLVLAVAPLALLAAVKPRLNIATVTAIIVLLVPTMTPVNPLDSAVDRVLEVGVGAVVGLVVSFFILPSRAQGLAIAAAARALDLMAVALGELLAGLTGGHDTDALHRLQDGIGQALVTLTGISAEAQRERATGLSRGPDPAPQLRNLLRLRHDLVIVGRAAASPLPPALQERLGPSLQGVRAAATTYLSASAAALREQQGPPPLAPVRAALDAYAAEVAAVRRDGLVRPMSGEMIERFFALGFALEQLHQNFRDLEMRVAERAKPGLLVAKPPAA
ncbi:MULTISPECIES: FUSC family protein [Rhodopseudomonas]|uniref:Membrane protein n=1 Tax=Rhodopseudomonas palustris TaxID=1076 RepID=A0A0D7E997_RHOPL|nr:MULTISPECIES: FUSC family protein [Rhodopseudomonas]KIZ37424.1 membrane protein [Rhodopseudomonas palustris]MDF3814018.1 FUSC family protein [Rhodopseudomonas sp. BAL398]WOK16837.1 FUSC family protein [Rhodopseudomonas sp. BAL398]